MSIHKPARWVGGLTNGTTKLLMKTITVRLPETLLAAIDAESRLRKTSKSEVIRERLRASLKPARCHTATFEAIVDLIGSVASLPTDLSSRKKWHLKASGYGKKHQ